MKFSIRSIILWAKNKDFKFRQVEFTPNSVNMLTGASRTGKSAIIPIIDYCLGANECTIPVGVIRDTCEWFGILIDMNDEQMLICRREPGQQKSTGDMYLCRGTNLVIPSEIQKNVTLEQVKNTLNELFQLTLLDIDPAAPDNFGHHPSYRDLMAFIFQPQNVIANNRVLFYNVENIEHKRKLVNIFPYVLGAITTEILMAKQERDSLLKEKTRAERELANIQNVAESWRQEVLTWLSQAKELGLTDLNLEISPDFQHQIAELRRIATISENEATIKSTNIQDTSAELHRLREIEQTLSRELSAVKQRYQTMNKLVESKNYYEESLETQKNRLDVSGWLRSLNTNSLCPLCGRQHEDTNKTLDELCNAMAEIERELEIVQGITLSFDREYTLVKSEINTLTDKITAIRKRIITESTTTQESASTRYTLAGVARFLGRMEFAIQTYERIGTDGDIETKLKQFNKRINELDRLINAHSQERKIKSALSYIQQQANEIIKQLDTEHPDDPIEFDIKDLTIKIKTSDGRENYLWEIGSASNWLSYHIAISLAFQRFFQERGGISMPNIIVLDQPSQVYFPQQKLPENTTAEQDAEKIADEDKVAVKKIFATLSKYIEETKSEIQIIVMEHADEDIWGEFNHINLVERWRDGEKLVPHLWIKEK